MHLLIKSLNIKKASQSVFEVNEEYELTRELKFIVDTTNFKSICTTGVIFYLKFLHLN